MRDKRKSGLLLATLVCAAAMASSACTSFYNTLGTAMDQANGVQYRDIRQQFKYVCATGEVVVTRITQSNQRTMYVRNNSRQAVKFRQSVENHGVEEVMVAAGGSGQSKSYHARFGVVWREVLCMGK
jgi:hypothetical protein